MGMETLGWYRYVALRHEGWTLLGAWIERSSVLDPRGELAAAALGSGVSDVVLDGFRGALAGFGSASIRKPVPNLSESAPVTFHALETLA